MRDQLIPEERVLAIQEAPCRFINEYVLDKNGEFYYDGESVNMRILCKTFVALCM